MNTAAQGEVYGAANLTAEKHVEYQVCLSDAETEATTWSIADMDHIVNQLESESYRITSNEQIQLKMAFSIGLNEYEAWWMAIGIGELQKTIEQHVIHFGYPMMHLVSHIAESIRRTGSGNKFTTNITEQLYIGILKVVYQITNKVNPFVRCSCIMTGEPVFTIWRRHGLILPFNDGMILPLQNVATYYQLLINYEIHIEPINYTFCIVRMSPVSAPYHNRYII